MSQRTHALAVYGTLAPGEMNYEVVADITGRWRAGTIRGHRSVWEHGPYAGFPRLRLDPEGPEVPVAVLLSDQLPDHWERLDAFEGVAYERVPTTVTFTDGPDNGPDTGMAWVYETDLDFDPANHGPGPYHGSRPPH